MEEEFRRRVIETLRKGEDLPPEWARELFPPEKREYELVYYDKAREEDILADTMAVPLQPVRTFGKNGGIGWTNMLIFGDNLQVMKSLIEQKNKGQLCNEDGTPGIRLIYIDPPFSTRKEFKGTQDQKAYQDKLAGTQFLEFLRRRLVLMRELLSADGSIVVHLDLRKCHYVKVLMDEIFQENRILNEIVWHYENKLGTGGDVFDGRHDTLFWYAAGSKHVFERVLEPVKERKLQPVTQKIGGERVWLRDKNGDRLYAKSRETRPVGDVWNIPIINPVADERLGYPTQKPEALAARVITAWSRPGDIVLDAFAGSGTACAASEKLGRRWIGVDCGKLAIYTIQKRMLALRENIGNTGKPLKAKPFTLHNAGLYDFSTLKKLPWADWRFFALQLFGCKDEPHEIGGIKLDGKLKGASVLVFNHHAQTGRRIDEDTIHDIHLAVGKKIGRRFFVIAPRGIFDFQQDYLDFDGVRYYALRIPYSFINELHQRQFSALAQPRDESAVNATVDAVGFDFIQPPTVVWKAFIGKREGSLIRESCIEVKTFESRARVRGSEKRGGMETLSTILIDCDYKGDVFNLDLVFFADELKENGSRAWFPVEKIGANLMAVFMDIYGNEATDVVAREKFVKTRTVAKAAGTRGGK